MFLFHPSLPLFLFQLRVLDMGEASHVLSDPRLHPVLCAGKKSSASEVLVSADGVPEEKSVVECYNRLLCVKTESRVIRRAQLISSGL